MEVTLLSELPPKPKIPLASSTRLGAKKKTESGRARWPSHKIDKVGNLQPSTFFSPLWSQARIEYEVAQAFKVRQPTSVPNQWRGTSPAGIEIQGYSTPARTTFYPIGN
ncbi:EndoU domain-containing protein [Polaromonas sp. YR568]|uniref:EndoU domain-containing protein n=1 Tax=Polaromonas sp. YR568 TaxID=1855301 RepID=UPI000B85B992